jgi:hypothetical protein
MLVCAPLGGSRRSCALPSSFIVKAQVREMWPESCFTALLALSALLSGVNGILPHALRRRDPVPDIFSAQSHETRDTPGRFYNNNTKGKCGQTSAAPELQSLTLLARLFCGVSPGNGRL